MPQISVIVPVYKVEKYIHRCVDSILAQTFTDFELILVDDGSPDNCGAICDEYAARDPRIHVIHKKNGGLSSARNAGLDIAQGEYIMFCDSDDYVAPDWCEWLLKTVCSFPNSFIVSNLWKVWGDIQQPYQPVSTHVHNTSYFTIYKYGLSAYAVNKIYSADVIKKHHLQFDEACYFAEDVEFNSMYCSFCSDCIYIAKPLYYYVDTSDSIMNRYRENLFELHLPLFNVRLPLISESDLGEYCDIWLYQFLQLSNNVFDSHNSMSFLEKLRYNHKMINTKELKFCLAHASGKNENPLVLNILRTHNYYLFWFFNQLVKLKGKIRRKQL